MIKLPQPLTFDWDEGNIEKNWNKHKVNQKECEEIFLNRPLRLFKDIKHSQKESRFTAFGSTNSRRKLYIVFAIRGEKLRVISARDQSKKERKLYES